MSRRKQPPELVFQQYIADFLIREHGYGVVDQSEITDTNHVIVEDQLWAFLVATQRDKLEAVRTVYGADARVEVSKSLAAALAHTPLWMLLRHGLGVRDLEFRLYYPRPRSASSAATAGFRENRIAYRPHFYFGPGSNEIDFVFFLNGLPIVALELKHELNQTVHDAVAQYARRDHSHKIFQHPFLFLAADTADVMAATDPRAEQNFSWHNTGLTNEQMTAGGSEYPVEFLYREVLSKERLLEALSFFLVRVPQRAAEGDRLERPASTIFPRYHQSRTVRNVASDAAALYTDSGKVGRKYLINHSAGSGKTLTMCWLADRLHSLYRPDSVDKLFDHIFILTDRKSLDTNIKDDLDNFKHLEQVVGLARMADDLPRFLKERRPIIVTTQQKFAWVLEQIKTKPELKELRVAFLIDEAHRSQEGRMGAAIRLPFRKATDHDNEPPEGDPQDELAKVIRQYDVNQTFVAFTATPAPATLTLFGQAFDTYSEAEAIAEGYIVDVASSIISYKTLYNLHCAVVPDPEEERLYPKGVVAKALQNVAFNDDGLIQYKAEVMLRVFEKDVMPLIGGRAKAMIVTASRVAGLRYFQIIEEKLRERGANYKALYAFSDFVHPETNAQISEHAVNRLDAGELIEERFEGEDYRLMVVANKFQTGFNVPLLAGMFLDKPVLDRNAVQTISRLNRRHDGKSDVIVVDFTNNARAILKAFAKYRRGTPFQPDEPDQALVPRLHDEILAAGVFVQDDATDLLKLLASGTDAQAQSLTQALRTRFQAKVIDLEDRKAFVHLLARYAKAYHFLTCFFSYSPAIDAFSVFAEYVGPQLIKAGSVSELMKQIRETEVVKAAVIFQGVERGGTAIKLKSSRGGRGAGPPMQRVSVQDMVSQIQARYDISDDEALYIKQVTEEKSADSRIHATVVAHQSDRIYLDGPYREQVNGEIQTAYDDRGRYDELADPRYTETGAIFDIMAVTVIDHHLEAA